jgi:RND superfamily putative drug exporter
VVAFWVLVVVALGSLAGKLQGAEKNDSSAYLPSSAESTQELNEQNLFQSQNLNPALVVYVRPGGETAADMRKAEADARYFATLPAVRGRVAAPVLAGDHKAIETAIGADLGYNSDLSGGPDRHDHAAARAARRLRPLDLLAGQAGPRFRGAD